jgi:GAF domain-containing protein
MVTITPELAERIADLARLLLDDDSTDTPLRQLTDLALELIPGSAAAGIVAAGDKAWVSVASNGEVADLHRHQLETGDGPVAEALRHGEARRVDDAADELRWRGVCAQIAAAGYLSCLALPLQTSRRPGGALTIYGRDRGTFSGSEHDIALLFAAQGGVAFDNAAAYRDCRQLVSNLQAALESRAVIEQAKGILVAEYGYTPDIAFKHLSTSSQKTNRKVRDLSADLVAGRINQLKFGPADPGDGG